MIIKSKLQFFILFIFIGVMALLNSNAFAATPIDCGQTTPGSISVIGEKDDYTFTANPNDGALITVVRTSGDMNPYIELYDSAGTKIAEYNSYSGNFALINKGTYTVVVYDYGNNGTGTYNIRYQNLTTACNETAITCGQSTPGSISPTGEIDFYSFTTTTAGNKASIRLSATSGTADPYLKLYNSAGTEVTPSFNIYTLTSAGAYTIMVYDDGHDETGGYSLTYLNLTTACNATTVLIRLWSFTIALVQGLHINTLHREVRPR
ncbi:MAG: hypothetical protein HY755_08075 [Nitrospirae bacterium]|nr:hypothetical protein [Nitrospirota bacterium]